MNTLSIFLGSSFRLSHERVLIGDGIRRLSDEWEQKGVRIHLLIWEDYRSEFTGSSKQKEYDHDLVEKSDIVFAMFRDGIGPWTEHEIDVALKTKQPNIHCYCLPSANRPQVVSQLQAKGIDSIEVNNGNTIFNYIKQTIEKFIADNNLTSTDISTSPNKYVYATIPSDMKSHRIQLGNVIRSIDMLAERQLNLRCRLHPYNTEALIANATDHYIGLFNHKVNKIEQSEFQTAVKAIDDHRRLAAITIFKQTGGSILESSNPISSVLKSREIFTVGIGSSADRLYLKLLLWLYSTVFHYIDVNDSNISLRDNKINFFGCPIADISSIDKGQKIRNLINQKQHLEEELRNVSLGEAPDKNNRLYSLSTNISSLNAAIMHLLVLELNALLYNPSKYEIDESQDLNTDELLAATNLEAEILTDLNTNYSTHWNHRQQAIYERIEVLRKNITSVEEVKTLASLIDARNHVLQLAYDHGFIHAHALMDSLLYSVEIVDTYINGSIEYDEDSLYSRIIHLADSTCITSPMIEMMRLNLGNAYARIDDYDQAIEHYRTALKSFRTFDHNQPAVRNYLAHLYMCAVTQSIDYYPHNPELKYWISDFMRLSHEWYSQDKSFVIERALALTCYLAELEFEAYKGKEEASEAVEIMELLLKDSSISPEENFYGDVYCYFPNAIGRYYLEQMLLIKEEETNKEYYYKSGKYLNISLQKAKVLENINYPEYLIYSSNANHNLGMLHASQDYKKAIHHYREALSMRRKLLEATNNPSYEKIIAQTLVNTCWIYVYYITDIMREKPSGDIALPENPVLVASEALEIHRKYYKEGVLGLETNYYTALLLNGYLNIILSCTSFPTDPTYGIQCIKQCKEWDELHPNNDQHYRIYDIINRVNLA